MVSSFHPSQIENSKRESRHAPRRLGWTSRRCPARQPPHACIAPASAIVSAGPDQVLAARPEGQRELNRRARPPWLAERLYLSVRTVERHLSNIYAKLRISGRACRRGGTLLGVPVAHTGTTCTPPGAVASLRGGADGRRLARPYRRDHATQRLPDLARESRSDAVPGVVHRPGRAPFAHPDPARPGPRPRRLDGHGRRTASPLRSGRGRDGAGARPGLAAPRSTRSDSPGSAAGLPRLAVRRRSAQLPAARCRPGGSRRGRGGNPLRCCRRRG